MLAITFESPHIHLCAVSVYIRSEYLQGAFWADVFKLASNFSDAHRLLHEDLQVTSLHGQTTLLQTGAFLLSWYEGNRIVRIPERRRRDEW